MPVLCQPLKTLTYMEWLQDVANLSALSKVSPKPSGSQC